LIHLSLAHHFSYHHAQATTAVYTLPLHDALPIYAACASRRRKGLDCRPRRRVRRRRPPWCWTSRSGPRVSAVGQIVRLLRQRHRSEEHTSELQSRGHLVCRLLLEKKKKGPVRTPK